MSKHGEKKKIIAGVAPEGKRLSGPGTRSKNPRRYDANKHLSKNYVPEPRLKEQNY